MSRRIPLLALLLFALATQPAAAATWTGLDSNTTQEITAVEFEGGDRFWFTTADGRIFARDGGSFEQRHAVGAALVDIEFEGNIGLAARSDGRLARSTNGGVTWSDITLPGAGKWDGSTNCSPAEPVGALHFVRHVGSGVWYAGGDAAQLLRSTDDGASWSDANAHAGGCRVNTGEPLADIAPTGDPDVFYVATGADQAFYTSNGLTSNAAERGGEVANGMEGRGTMAIDPGSVNRLWGACGGCPYGNSGAQYTEDGWVSSNWIDLAAGTFPDEGPFDVAFGGGTVVYVGNGGLILSSVNGRDFFRTPASGALQTQDWRAVSVADADDAAVGGTGGKLAITTDADVMPDLEPPTVTLSGPAGVRAGQPATFTATAADTGGSGIDPDGFAWSATGLPGATAQASHVITFPEAGTYTVSVVARDLAGNLSAVASTTVAVERPIVAFPPAGSSGVSARRQGRWVRVRVRGRLTAPAGKSCAGKLRVLVKRKKKTLKKKTLKVRSSCRYRRTLKVRRKRVGSAKRLRVVLRFLGNGDVGPSRISYSTRVR